MVLINGMELLISKATKDDAEAIIKYLNLVGGESDNLLFGKNGFHMDVESEEKFIENVNQSDKSALFVGKVNAEIVCVGSIQSPNRERISHQCDLAISVKRHFWNKGIGTELMKTLTNFAKQTKQIEIIHLGVRSDNINAIRLYKKMGFCEIGLYKNFFKINGEYADEILMNLYL